jgi:hypothetical protein
MDAEPGPAGRPRPRTVAAQQPVAPLGNAAIMIDLA